MEKVPIGWEHVRQALEKTSILYWNYRTLKVLLKGLTKLLVGMNGPEQSLVYLVDGLVAEIER